MSDESTSQSTNLARIAIFPFGLYSWEGDYNTSEVNEIIIHVN